MREILFRGKLPDGEWAEGYIVKGCCTYILTAENIHYMSVSVMGHANVDVLPVKPETVGQYTGLKDKNGKRIFEGDLVKAVLPGNSGRLPFVWPISPVVYKGSRFGLDMNKSTGGFVSLDGFAPSVTCEVIGNIHDNPELIGGAEDV